MVAKMSVKISIFLTGRGKSRERGGESRVLGNAAGGRSGSGARRRRVNGGAELQNLLWRWVLRWRMSNVTLNREGCYSKSKLQDLHWCWL